MAQPKCKCGEEITVCTACGKLAQDFGRFFGSVVCSDCRRIHVMIAGLCTGCAEPDEEDET